MLGFIPWRILSYHVGRLSWILLYGILRTDINLFLREILLSIVILVFKKSEYSRFKGRCFFALDLVELKTEFLGYLKRRVLWSQVICAASAIANNDVKIKEIISNFLAACRSCMSFALVYQLGKRKIWDWLLAVWGSLSTCLRELKSSLSFLEARARLHKTPVTTTSTRTCTRALVT